MIKLNIKNAIILTYHKSSCIQENKFCYEYFGERERKKNFFFLSLSKIFTTTYCLLRNTFRTTGLLVLLFSWANTGTNTRLISAISASQIFTNTFSESSVLGRVDPHNWSSLRKSQYANTKYSLKGWEPFSYGPSCCAVAHWEAQLVSCCLSSDFSLAIRTFW